MSKLHRVRFFQDHHNIYTENAEKEIWEMIMKFSDIFYLKKKWEGRTNDEYFKVSSWIKQSYEFQIATKNVTLNAKPLLMYYSFLNLSKAIYYIVKDKSPNEMHGLTSPSIGEDFLEISTNIKNGVFKDLCELTGDNLSDLGDSIDIRKMLDNFLEIHFDYIDYFGFDSKFLIPNVNIFLDGDIEIYIKNNIDKFTKKFNGYELKNNNDKEKYFFKNLPIGKSKEGLLDKEFSKLFQYNIIGNNQYYLNNNDNSISSISSIYGLIFILGSVVRYKPEYFYKITSNNEDSIGYFISKVLSISNRVYPNSMLNLLYGKSIVFGKNNLL